MENPSVVEFALVLDAEETAWLHKVMGEPLNYKDGEESDEDFTMRKKFFDSTAPVRVTYSPQKPAVTVNRWFFVPAANDGLIGK